MHDLQAAVRLVANDDLLTRQRPGKISWIKDEQHLVLAQGQGLRQSTDFLPAHGAIEVLVVGQRPVHVLRIAWRLAKTSIEILDKRRCIEVCRFDRIDIAQPQFLHQPILQRLVGAFYAAFGLRGVGADNVDVQLIKRAPELR